MVEVEADYTFPTEKLGCTTSAPETQTKKKGWVIGFSRGEGNNFHTAKPK